MDESSGFIFGFLLDGNGGGRSIGQHDLDAWQEGSGPLWLHLDRSAAGSRRWLTEASGLDPLVIEALLAEETRPRIVNFGHGLLVILRGVNLNPGADPEDMVAVRMWIDGYRAISIRSRKVIAICDLQQAIEAGRGPRSAPELLVKLAACLINRMAPVIEELDEQADDLEEQLLTGDYREARHGLREIRHTAITLRRHLAPQRDALARFQSENVPWLDQHYRARLREDTDRVIRHVEDLDEIRERASVMQDELINRHTEQMNRNMFLLSAVAAIMLPLGFLTSLLGINVGGIPWATDGMGFLIVCLVLLAIGVVEIIIARRLHWF